MLGDELASHGDELHVPVLGSGHPLADIFLLKWTPQPSEIQEGVAFFGRSGQALLKSLQRLHVDPLAVYGTNCLKFGTEDAEDARAWLTRELHIVQPKVLVAMGEQTVGFVNELAFPLVTPARRGRRRHPGASRPRSRRSSRPTSTPHWTSRRRRPGSGTPSRRSAPGGRSCRRTEPAAGPRRSSRCSPRSSSTAPGQATSGTPPSRGTSPSSRSSSSRPRSRSSGSCCPPPASSYEAPCSWVWHWSCWRCSCTSPVSARSSTSRRCSRSRLSAFAFLSFFQPPLGLLVLIAAVIPWVDAYSVWRGPTNVVVNEHPGLFDRIAVAFREPGQDYAARLGPPDVFFFAVFLAAAQLFRLRTGWTFIGMLACLGADARARIGVRRLRPAGASCRLGRVPGAERRPALAPLARVARQRSSNRLTDSMCGVCGNMSTGRQRISS